MNNKEISFVFFGTPEFSVTILEELKQANLLPSLVVTREDKPQGRHLVITPPPVKVWAEANGIPVLQPQKLDPEFLEQLKSQAKDSQPSLFVVCAYGKIIPQTILDIPTYGTLNVHPSLLPKLRGPSPVQSAILEEDQTGVTIMLLDAEMDHGPIVAQEVVPISDWPPYESQLEDILAHVGGKLLANTLPRWVGGDIKTKEQHHARATFCKKVKKEDAFIDLSANAMENLRKIRAYATWPRAHTILKHDGKEISFIIKKARIEDGSLVLERVVVPGKKEMSFEEFQRGFLHTKKISS